MYGAGLSLGSVILNLEDRITFLSSLASIGSSLNLSFLLVGYFSTGFLVATTTLPPFPARVCTNFFYIDFTIVAFVGATEG